ncbi:MAG: hypothetical protein Pars2KO_15910 [Parasphingorhabdus sp.]
MKRMALFLFVLLFGGAVYYYVLDGSLPEDSNYDLNISEIRSLADAPKDQLPTEIRTEILATPSVPRFALRAGSGFGQTIMLRNAFQIVSPNGYYALETGMDKALGEEFDQAEGFDAAVWDRIQTMLSGAKGIMVTHEHPDHIGGIVRHRNPAELADKLILTQDQFNGLNRFTVSGALPPEFSGYVPVSIDRLHRVAPGIVMIKAAGHTPGSVMFFVKLASGAEYLFIGDIAYTESNVVDGVDRSRFIRLLMVDPEDRDAVVHQLKAIHELSKVEPELHIVPAHAEKVILKLLEDRRLIEGFDLREPVSDD